MIMIIVPPAVLEEGAKRGQLAILSFSMEGKQKRAEVPPPCP